MSRECEVRGCHDPSTGSFDASEEGQFAMEYAACDFHLQALHAGDTWQVDKDNRGELLLGSQGALRLIGSSVELSAPGLPSITMVFGHDGVESERVTFQATPEQIQNICYWAGPEGAHPGVA